MLNIKIILPLISATLSLFLGFIVLKRKKTKITHISFFFLALSVALWTGGVAFLNWNQNIFWSNFLARIIYFFGGSIAVAFFYFSCVFTPSKIKISVNKKGIIFGQSVILFILYFFTNFIISGTFTINEYNKGFTYGPLRFLFEIHIWTFFIFAFIKFIKIYRHTSNLIKSQIKHILFGVYISLGIASLTNIVFLWWGYFNLVWLGASGSLVWITLTTYAILRYRFLDIRLAFRRSFLKIILAAFAYGTFYGASWLFIKLFGSVWVRPALIIGIFIAIAFAILWPVVEKLTLKFSNKYVYASVFNAQETISRLAQNLTATVNLKKISTLISETVFSSMNVQKVALMVKDIRRQNLQTIQTIHFSETKLSTINRKKKLLVWLNQHKLAIVRGEIELESQDQTDKKIKQEMQQVEQAMAQINAEIILPLNIKDKLIGLILLGEKKSSDAYTAEEIKLLETLANQSAIAIQNALLYNNQEQIIAQRTQALKEQNIHLQKLLKMRSDFLDIASHQLRTPTSVIKGNLSMFIDGDFDKNPEAQKTAIQNMFEKTEKLNCIINDILVASELDTENLNLAPLAQSEDIVQITQKSIKFLQDRINEKKIKFSFNYPTEKLPVKSYERYLSMIIDNLLDNAITYTPKGGSISVSLKKEKNNSQEEVIKFAISDTGIGIPQADQKNLFDKFKRAGNANNMKTDGTGIGLFIVKKLVKAHPGGKIGFQSQENKGSVFWFSLPEYG